MSDQIDVAKVNQYRANVELLLQREGSQLASLMRNEQQTAEFEYFDRVGEVAAVEILDRHGDSPQIDTPHSRRQVHFRDFEWGDLIDKPDDLRTLADFRSPYAVNGAMALGRKQDDIIVDAFFGDAKDGKAGATTTVFPAGNIIARDFKKGGGGAASGLTIDKLLEAKRLLSSFHNKAGQQVWHIGVGSTQMDDLLHDSLIQNIDTNIIRALVQGDIKQYGGFMFHEFEGFNVDAANADREIPCWVEDGMITTNAQAINVESSKRADKRYNWYIYVKGSFGASRMEENKVIKILCDE